MRSSSKDLQFYLRSPVIQTGDPEVIATSVRRSQRRTTHSVLLLSLMMDKFWFLWCAQSLDLRLPTFSCLTSTSVDESHIPEDNGVDGVFQDSLLRNPSISFFRFLVCGLIVYFNNVPSN